MNHYDLNKRMEEELFHMNRQIWKSPHVLDDITTKAMYDSLMNVQDVESLRRWEKALEKTTLSAFMKCSDNTDEQDFFGDIHSLLMTMDEEDLEETVFLIRMLRETGFDPYYHRKKVEQCVTKSRLIHENSPDAIVLFRQSNSQYCAFGEDSDALYERYGWQTAAIDMDGEEKTSFMYVYPKGYDFLVKEGASLIPLTCDYPIDFNVTSPEDLLLSDSQQTIDYFRTLIKDDDLVFSSQGLSYAPVINGMETEVRYPFVWKMGDSLGVFNEDGLYESIVRGHAWRVDEGKAVLVNNLAFILLTLMMTGDRLQHEIGAAQVEQDNAKALELFSEYTDHKKEHPDSMVIMKSGDTLFSFYEDALSLTRHRPRTIWTLAENPIVFLPEDVVHMTAGRKDVLIVETKAHVVFEQMRLKGSILNYGVRSPIDFTHPRIFKTLQGEYAIQAEVDDRTIPMVKVDKRTSDLILNVPEGILRDVTIRSFLITRLYARYTSLKTEDFA